MNQLQLCILFLLSVSVCAYFYSRNYYRALSQEKEDNTPHLALERQDIVRIHSPLFDNEMTELKHPRAKSSTRKVNYPYTAIPQMPCPKKLEEEFFREVSRWHLMSRN